MTFGSLFSGIGGFDLGFTRAGMVPSWMCEIDGAARGVLRHHWPEVPIYEDVREVGSGVPRVDLICGGFPCQDLSVAGRRAGLDGERSGLWFEYRRIVEQLRPTWVVIENVPGLLSSNEGRDFAVVLSGLAELGYGVAYRILDAQYFGVAQRRRRVFIVASLGDGRCAQVLFEPYRSGGDTEARGETRAELATDVAASLRSSGDNDAQALHIVPDVQRLAAPLVARQAKGAFTDPVNDNVIAVPALSPALRCEGHDASEDGTQRRALVPVCFDTTQITSPGNYSAPQPGAPCHLLAAAAHAPTVAFTERTRADGRNFEAQEELAYALTNPGSGGRTHSRQIAGQFGVRRLTPKECERLQGFPDGHTAVNGQSDSPRYRQLGNAVAVPCAEWIGRRIMEVSQ